MNDNKNLNGSLVEEKKLISVEEFNNIVSAHLNTLKAQFSIFNITLLLRNTVTPGQDFVISDDDKGEALVLLARVVDKEQKSHLNSADMEKPV